MAKGVKGQELWRPGVKTGLGPGKQVFIALPKARGEGGVRYADSRIHPNTMLFLGELKANNDREWLKGECGLLTPARVYNNDGNVEGGMGVSAAEVGEMGLLTRNARG